MSYLVGTDEAGYGPNLGPLVVSASVWEVPAEIGSPGTESGCHAHACRGHVRPGEAWPRERDHGTRQSALDQPRRDVDLYATLAGAIAPSIAEASPTRVAVADSKRLYAPGGTLAHLERGVLTALAVLGRPVARSRDAWEALDPGSEPARREIPWQADHDEPLPIDAKAGEIQSLGQSLAHGLDAAGIRLVDLRSRAVFPQSFNHLVARFDSKGHALSHVTLSLVAELLAALPEGTVQIVCDKHGGRNRYGPLVAEYLCDGLVETCEEGRQASRYRFGPPWRRVEIAFRAGGEAWLPAALASMASKYLRELAMRAMNAFWLARVEGLRPTAGYPLDAARFRREVAAAQATLKIPDEVFWRTR